MVFWNNTFCFAIDHFGGKYIKLCITISHNLLKFKTNIDFTICLNMNKICAAVFRNLFDFDNYSFRNVSLKPTIYNIKLKALDPSLGNILSKSKHTAWC